MKVIFLSSNPGKIEAALYAFGKHGIELVPTSSRIPEIQADRSVEIARFAVEHHVEFGLPVVREDHALYINALGIPGP